MVAKMAIDQLLWSPAFTCVFFTYIEALKGNLFAVPSIIASR